MPTWVFWIGGVAAVLLVAYTILVKGGIFVVVPQETRMLKERWGRYVGTLEPGKLHKRLVLRDKFVGPISLKMQPHNFQLITRTVEDGTRVQVDFLIEFRVDPDKVREAWYAMKNPAKLLEARATEIIMQHLNRLSLKEALDGGPALGTAIMNGLTEYAADYGYLIHRAFVIKIDPESSVQSALVEKATAARKNETAAANATAANKLAIDKAKADAEVSELTGQAEAARQTAVMDAMIALAKKMAADNNAITFQDALAAVMKAHEIDATSGAIRAAGTSIVNLGNGADGVASSVAAGTKAATTPATKHNER